MKKLLLLTTIVLFFFVTSQSQTYHPFPDTTGYWNYRYYDDFHLITSYRGCYTLYGDTTILSVNYKKISGFPAQGNLQSGAIRESSKIIYYRPDTSSNEYILYNFNLNVGDTIFHPYGGAVCSNDTVIVDYIDSVVLSDGFYHRQLHLSSYSIWIEGIGSYFYLLEPCEVACVSGNDNIECMQSNSTFTYSGISCTGCTPIGIQEQNLNKDISISPNPFTDKTTIAFSEEQKNTPIKIKDILGKEIKTINFSGKQLVIDKAEMKAGIYFVQTTDEKKNVINKKIIIQ